MTGASTPPSDPAGYGSGGVSQPGDLPRIEHGRSDPPARLANLCCGHAACQREVARAVDDALASVLRYCRVSEGFAEAGISGEAIGLARAYKDVADRLEARLAGETGEASHR